MNILYDHQIFLNQRFGGPSRYFCSLIDEISKENLNQKKSFFGLSKRSSDYAQAIMEIGALICKPSLPFCIHCPLTRNCKSYKKKDFIIKSKIKFNKTKYFEANIYKYKHFKDYFDFN